MIINDDEVMIKIEDKLFHCAMDVTMHFISGKWKTVVLWYLCSDIRRFGELKAKMPQITEKMLSIQLKQLEKDGLIERIVYSKKPPLKVEYTLTDFGRSLLPVIDEIARWGRQTGKDRGEIVRVN
ncbi:MAG: helix-turn-helix domain-containing protein, partial [Saprospiraceae bacterium]|nr:helix-turn-helix domain-containing protein [Saprospiraceae bacterium]